MPRRVSSAAADRASNMANVIELVGFDEEVCNVIKHVFGSTLVVDGMKAENSICDATKTLTITLERCLSRRLTQSEMADYSTWWCRLGGCRLAGD